ncbi:MAG: hypothetical protein HQK59_05475 [Deltaproteobacteria bacterium]|nr:hypothetical protein [Deltaproteobacteria bacterium]
MRNIDKMSIVVTYVNSCRLQVAGYMLLVACYMLLVQDDQQPGHREKGRSMTGRGIYEEHPSKYAMGGYIISSSYIDAGPSTRFFLTE